MNVIDFTVLLSFPMITNCSTVTCKTFCLNYDFVIEECSMFGVAMKANQLVPQYHMNAFLQ
jgi:hypothetical protein